MQKIICLVVFTAFFINVIFAIPATSKIHSELQKSLKFKTKVDILISFQDGTDGVLNKLKHQQFATRADRALMVTELLKTRAAESQTDVINFLNIQRLSTFHKITSLWVSNQVYVRGASPDLVNTLTEFQQISEIKEDEWIPLSPVSVVEHSDETGIQAEWGIENIRAPYVWNAPGGNIGEGVIVSTVDTGVRYTHQALRDNYVGDNGGWFDPYENTTSPNDQNGVGTHIMGIIAGTGGIGVAPGAHWSSCKGCATSSCSQSSLLACGQWTVCPNSGCTLTPQISSNSWGGGRGQDWFDNAIRAMKAAGVVVIFPVGGSGPSCNTANSPSDSVAGPIAVCSTLADNSLASGSSRGPSAFGQIKPDICGPASANSSYHTSDTAYTTLSGTSIASPHVAGVAALLLSQNPNLDPDEVAQVLFNGANRNLPPTGQDCGGVPDSEFPNNSYGYGKVDALDSFIALLTSYCKK